MLEILLAQTADHKILWAEVRKTIIEPAFSLAHKINLSVDRFDIQQSPNYHLPHDRQKQPEGEFDHFELVDLATGGRMASPSENVEYIFDITPRLLFRSVKADEYAETKILKKPRVLVAVTKEGQKSVNEPIVSRGQDPTVLSLLDRVTRIHIEKYGRASGRTWIRW